MANDYKATFFPGAYYHVFNHAVGDEQLFRNKENYHYFLRLFDKYISPIATVFSYCLLPNHFHLLIRIGEADVLATRMELLQYRKPVAGNYQSSFVLQQFSNCFNAYTKALNKQQQRMGKLFMEPFHRRNVESAAACQKVVHYIHANPVHHGFCTTVEGWEHSSYSYILRESPALACQEVVTWFGGVENFIAYHQQPIQRRF